MNAEFDRHAATYSDEVADSIAFVGQHHSFFTQAKVEPLLRVVRQYLGDPAGVRALDVGCGVGETDALLADRLLELHGVDVAPAAVEVAAERNSSVAYTSYNGAHLPYDDGAFDLVFAICVLHHVLPPLRPAFTAELARVAAPKGLVVLIEHNPWNPLTRLAVARCSFDDDAVLVRRGRADALLRRAGLDMVEWRYFLFLPWSVPGAGRIESALRWLPLGAQYLIASRKPATAYA
jgi:SAM-dependent methyltransferase